MKENINIIGTIIYSMTSSQLFYTVNSNAASSNENFPIKTFPVDSYWCLFRPLRFIPFNVMSCCGFFAFRKYLITQRRRIAGGCRNTSDFSILFSYLCSSFRRGKIIMALTFVMFIGKWIADSVLKFRCMTNSF